MYLLFQCLIEPPLTELPQFVHFCRLWKSRMYIQSFRVFNESVPKI